MAGGFDRLALALARRRAVAIDACVHFCGYRYGRGEFNPYEAFSLGLANGVSLADVRGSFVEYLGHYRPKHLGQALGVNLSKNYPLWYLPWRTPQQVSSVSGWQEDPNRIVDVMTHFCELGIPSIGLQREFAWHERAFDAIRTQGYQPATHGYATVRELRHHERSAYLVTDGNHRISALSALEQSTVVVKIPHGTTIDAARADTWPLVRAGVMTHSDALGVFNAYLSGNQVPARSAFPAPII